MKYETASRGTRHLEIRGMQWLSSLFRSWTFDEPPVGSCDTYSRISVFQPSSTDGFDAWSASFRMSELKYETASRKCKQRNQERRAGVEPEGAAAHNITGWTRLPPSRQLLIFVEIYQAEGSMLTRVMHG